MIGCLIVMVLLGLPRVVLALVWLFTPWFGLAYETALWPFMGWIFLPYTTGAYMAAMLHNDHQVSGGWLVVVVVGVLFDLGSYGTGPMAKHRRRRRR
jgi:hypothetical protein